MQTTDLIKTLRKIMLVSQKKYFHEFDSRQ